MIEIIKTPSVDLNIDEFTYNVETDTIIDLCVNTLNDGFQRVNKMFGLSCKAEKKYPLADMQQADQKGGAE